MKAKSPTAGKRRAPVTEMKKSEKPAAANSETNVLTPPAAGPAKTLSAPAVGESSPLTTEVVGKKRLARKRVTAPVAGTAAQTLKKNRSTVNEPSIELFPHGISVTTPMGRPVLVLKDKASIEVLPVWMQPLDAGVALAELSHGSGATPHAVIRRLFQALDLKLESCTFVDVVGHHQFVDLVFNRASIEGNQPVVTRLERVRADEAMSFCLQSRAHFFSTRTFMARCRDLDVDISKLETNLSNGLLPELKSEMELSSKKQPYVM